MSRCAAIKPNGERCKVEAIADAEWCWSHHPDYEQARRRRASKGGKRGGRGRPIVELGALRDENAEIRRRLLGGELLPNVAAVAVQSINTDIRAVGAAMKAREQEELAREVEELREMIEMNRDRSA